MSDTILLADDDIELCGLLKEYFESEGFVVRVANDGAAALDEAGKPGLDLVVLDVMMPKMNGMDVLRELRKVSRLPVIMLTAKGDDMDRILGLELGADDYVPKPCNPRELLARIRAVMRRAQVPGDHGIIGIDDLELSQGSRTLTKSGEAVELTSTEFSILLELLQHLSLIHISEPTRQVLVSRMPSSA